MFEVSANKAARSGGDLRPFVHGMRAMFCSNLSAQELGVWASSVLDFEFDLDFDMDEPETRRDCSFLALDILCW